MKLVRVAALCAALAATAAFAGVGIPERAHSQAGVGPAANTVTVSGTGSVEAVPDRAELSFGVTTEARTASAALSASSAEMRRVIAAIRGAGVAQADIQTQIVSLQPRYSERGDEIVGYTATNSVSAKLRDLGRAGAVIDAAVGAGANQVFGPGLTRSDQTALYRRALRAAVADARAKARSLAAAAGRRLGRVRSVVETGAAPPPRPLEAKAAATPIEPGTQLIQASVSVEFALV